MDSDGDKKAAARNAIELASTKDAAPHQLAAQLVEVARMLIDEVESGQSAPAPARGETPDMFGPNVETVDFGRQTDDNLRRAAGCLRKASECIGTAKNIQQTIKLLDMSRDEFAEFVGVAHQTVGHWVNGRHDPTGDQTAAKLKRCAKELEQRANDESA